MQQGSSRKLPQDSGGWEGREEAWPGWYGAGPPPLGPDCPCLSLSSPLESPLRACPSYHFGVFLFCFVFIRGKEEEKPLLSTSQQLPKLSHCVFSLPCVCRTKWWETCSTRTLNIMIPAFRPNQERLSIDLRRKGEEERVKRERVYLEINEDRGRKEATWRHTSLVSISLKQAAKNAFNPAIP